MGSKSKLLWGCLWLVLCVCNGCSEDASQSTVKQTPQQAPVSEPAERSISPSTPAEDASELRVLDISERERDGKNGIAVTLSSPLNTSKNIQTFFHVHTDKGVKVDGAWELDDAGKRVWFMDVEPQTEYRVSVDKTLVAKNNRHLPADVNQTLTTRSLRATVNFASTGSVLPVAYGAGLPIETVNVAAVDVDFFRVKDEQLSKFLNTARDYGRQSWAANYLKTNNDLVYSGRFDLNPAKNTRTSLDIPLSQIKALKTPGLYLALMRVPGDYERIQVTWFVITDLGIHIRQYPNEWAVRLQSLSSGEVQNGVHLELLDGKGKSLLEATTNSDGLATFNNVPKAAATLVAKKDNQWTFIDVRQSALDLSEFELGKRAQLPMEFFVYGPRDLYRPGEVATFAGLIRDGDGTFVHTPVLKAYIQAPSGSKVKEFNWNQQTLGYYQYDWAIPANAETGLWQLVVTGALAQPVVYEFHVEEFLPERLKVTVGAGKTRTVVTAFDQPLVVPITSEYLYGAPAAGNHASAFYQIRLWPHPVETLKNYYFGHVLDDAFTRHQELTDVQLDEQGQGQWTIDPNWQQAQSPLQLQMTGSVYESGGRAVTRTHSVLLWPAETLIGLRPSFKTDQNPSANSQITFDVINATVEGELKPLAEVAIKLVQEDRNYYWEYSDHEGWHWNWSDKEYVVDEQVVDLGGKDPSQVSFHVDWGRYRVEAKNLATGRVTSMRFFAGYDWYYDWQNAKGKGATRPDKINLALDKPAYSAGDTAQLQILPPAAGTVLIMVESDRPLWSQSLKVSDKGGTLAIPISSDWKTHNVYVTAMMVEPSGKTDRITPKRSFGLLHLPLARTVRQLHLAITAPEKTQPNKTLTVDLNLGGPVASTYVTLAAVDVGVLNISDFATPNAFEYFFGQRRYSTELKDMYGQVIEYHRFNAAKQRFGGDADLARGGKEPQTDVQIVSLFSGLVAVDEKGHAEVPLVLPDFNGRLRLMALAFNKDSYGSSDFEVTVAAPIVAEIAMPRFLAFGDKSQVALDVQNMTELDETIDLNFVSTGAVAMAKNSKNPQRFTLKPKQKITLTFPVEAIAVDGAGTFDLRLMGDHTGEMTRSWQLGVRPAYPAVTVKKSLVLSAGESLKLSAADIKGAVPSSLQGSIQINSTFNINVNEQLKDLLGYPYGCLEQTTSKAQPLVYATPAAQKQFNLPPVTDAERLKRIQVGVDRLVSFQVASGGFGLWSKDSPEEHWLTVYATEFLIKAQGMGAEVPQTLLDKAVKRLEFYLKGRGALMAGRWSEDKKHYAFATRAYAAWVLSQVNKAPLGSLRTLYERDFTHAQTPLPMVHLGLALIAAGDHKNGDEALTRALSVKTKEREYYGDYGSPIRDTAQTVQLLLNQKQHSVAALNLAQDLRLQIKARKWFSTQERTSLFLAGLALGSQPNEQWQGQWQVGGATATPLSEAGAWVKMLADDVLVAGATFTSKHPEPLFATAFVNGYPGTAPAAVDEGISIERNWYNVKGELVTPKSVKTGELLLVHLAVSSEERLPDTLVVNMLPAGFELENQNLDHAISMAQFLVDGKTVAELSQHTKIAHQEYRDDRYVAALDLNTYGSAHLFFMVRAVSPGMFQVPPAYAEDMYRPEIRGVSHSLPLIEVVGAGTSQGEVSK